MCKNTHHNSVCPIPYLKQMGKDMGCRNTKKSVSDTTTLSTSMKYSHIDDELAVLSNHPLCSLNMHTMCQLYFCEARMKYGANHLTINYVTEKG